MDILHFIEGKLISQRIFEFVDLQRKHIFNYLIKFLDYAFAGLHRPYDSNPESNFATQIKQLLT
ncbi:hypothetical protein AQ505_01930 [Pedobacter sp. PACM 27299]|nr:hypothetical protein AQ505_01930 [Pedobacter sp. PACM 27299]